MQKLNYFNFDLQIEKVSDRYTVQVLASPAGQATGKFDIPFSDLELENFLLRFGRPRTAFRRMETQEVDRAKSFGKRLFEAVFSGDVGQSFRASLNEVAQQEAGLRIRLRLRKAPELFDLPWEYLYDSTNDRFLALSNRTPLVHYLDLPERIAPLQVTPPLNILTMISAPSDYLQLDINKEWEKLKQAVSPLESRGLLHLDLLESPTLSALQRKLRQHEYHIFHFIGHGGFNEDTQDGLLLLQDENGRGKPVNGRFLGTILHDHASLRLAVLNACEGARTSKVDPFAGTAQSLMQQGIPAVIGMQFDISDEAAITLAHEFYSTLSDGFPVDTALTESRKAIFADGKELEWGAPVLYMRSPDGQIFSVASKDGSNNQRSANKKARPLAEAQVERAGQGYETAEEKKKTRAGQGSLIDRLITSPVGIALLLLGVFAIFAAIGLGLSSFFRHPMEVPSLGSSLVNGGDLRIGTRTPTGSVLAEINPSSSSTPTAEAVSTALAASTSTVEGTPLVPSTGPEATPTIPVPLPSSFQMMKVAGGKYTVGSQQNAQEVELADYWMDMYEVSNAAYARFLNEVHFEPPSMWSEGTLPAGKEAEPVRGVRWDAARAYCQWADKRLPTEAEWEVAARGPAGFLYPWGNEPGMVQLPEAALYPTGTIVENRSYFGLYDMAGNVWEWVDTPYAPVAAGERVIRGGSAWYSVDLTSRISGDPNTAAMYTETGFRCAASQVDPSSDGFLIHDDGFRQENKAWHQAAKPVGGFFYGIHPPEYYHVQVKASNSCISVTRDSSVTDFLMDVRLFTVATDPDNGEFFYGITFRETENKFYAVVISPRTQTWYILKHAANGFTSLDQAKDESLISSDLEVHHRIFVAARGPDLTVFIDGKLVSRVSDSDYTSGAIGFVARTKDETFIHVHYDSVDVWQLPGGSAATPADASLVTPKHVRQTVAPVCVGNVNSAPELQNYDVHYVKEGESWTSIADFYKMPVEKIYAANGRDPAKPGVLKPGNAIVIPPQGQ